MNEEVKITSWQAVFLIVNLILPTAILTVPSIIINYAKKDAWISVILATIIGLFVAIITSTISKKHPRKTIFEIVQAKLGIVICKIVGGLLAFYYFIASISILRQFLTFMVTSVMQRTPIIVLGMITLYITLYAISKGIEVISRSNQIILMVSFLLFSFSTLFYFKEMDFSVLLPMVETSWNGILLGSFTPTSWLSEVSVILILAPYLKKPERVRKIAITGVMITSFSLIWTIIGSIAVFGAEVLPTYQYPAFNVYRIIEVADFIERIDVLFIAVWMSTMVMKLAIFMYCGFYCLLQILPIQRKEYYLFPYGVLILSFTINSWANSSEFKSHQIYSVQTYLLFFNIVIPILLFSCVFLKNKTKQVEP